MSILFSTGLKGSIAVALKAVFDGGVIHVYSGTPPASPDLAPTGIWLGSITNMGVAPTDPTAGLTFEVEGQYLYKAMTAPWRLAARANGTLGWWRLAAPGDDPADTGFDSQRIDGLIGTGIPAVPPNATLWLPTIDVIAGQQHAVEYFMHTTLPMPE